MRFAHPLLLIFALALPWIWRVAAVSRPPVALGLVSWRAATALIVLLAASGLAVSTSNGPVTTIVALDRSASIPLSAQERALARIDALRSTMRPGDRLGLISFGARAAIEWRPVERGETGSVRADVPTSGTDIAAALRLARALAPSNGAGRILLMSDGLDDSGQAEREALYAAAAAVPIDVIPSVLDGASLALQVTRVNAPSTAAIQEPYVVSVEVSGAPRARGRVVVYRDDQIIGTPEVTTGADGTAGAALTERQERARTYTYRASMESDANVAVHPAGAVVVIEGQPAVLYVTDSAPALGPALTAAGFRVTVMRPAQLPSRMEALSPFAGIVLDDVPAQEIAPAALEALSEYVENSGGGLLVLGSQRSLTLAGYPATPLDRVLPIDLRPRAGARATPVEVVLVFDKSGSMAETVSGVSKIEAARQAVAEAVRLLPAGDSIAVLAFDSKPVVVSAMAVAPDQAALRTALTNVRPGGSTAISPALETAFQWFRDSGRPAARRHIVLVSDGRTSDDDAARLGSLVKTGGVEVSAVAIGTNANRALLEELARSTGGRAYFPENLRELPAAVAREASRSSAGGIVQERFAPRALAHAVLAGIDTRTLPPLNGYVVSAAKDSAAAILTSHLDDPILCAWRAGLGRVAVFTADLGSAWSADLRSWRGGGQLWTQTVRWLSRGDNERALRAQIRDEGAGPRLVVEGSRPDGSFLRLDTVRAVVRTPAGESTEIALEPLAPGSFAAPLPVGDAGPYVVAVTARDEQTATEFHAVRALYWSADRERQARGADLPFLLRLASSTGGRALPEGQSPFDGPRRAGDVDATRWLALAALLMFVLDLAYSVIFLRSVARFTPRMSAALTWLPLVIVSASRTSVDSTSSMMS